METKRPHAVRSAGSSSVASNNSRTSSTDQRRRPTLSLFTDDEHAVHITRGDGGLFAVTVHPPVAEYDCQTFPTHKAARGFASGIRMCRRWAIVDETEAGQ